MTISQAGIDLIKSFEGLQLKAYRCPAGVPTIGYGCTKGVEMGMKITPSQAEDMLRSELFEFERAVNRLADAPLGQHEFDALVSFAYNVGAGALEKSTLLKRLNAGDRDRASNEFCRWVKAAGNVLPGLVIRRVKERDWFLDLWNPKPTLLKGSVEDERAIAKLVKVSLEQHELEALISFLVDVGSVAFRRSTLLQRLNEGDRQRAADELCRWVKVGDEVAPDLVIRRVRERDRFLGKL